MSVSKILVVVLLAATLVAPGCAFATTPAGPGMIWTNVSVSDNVTDADNPPSKQGSGTIRSILGLFAFGDASAESAAREAGISEIHHVDYDQFSFLFIWGTYTVTVYGN